MDLTELGGRIARKLYENGLGTADGQVLALAEEAGEFVGAYRRWTGRARRNDDRAHVEEELADVVITAYVTAAVLTIDLDQAIARKTVEIFSRGWTEEG